MASLLDDVSPGAKRLLDILADAWVRTDQWPVRQYVAHEMATAGLDLGADNNVQGSLNLLKAAVKQHLNDPDHLQRAVDAIDALRDVVTLRRSQAHSGAARESLRAADRLGIRLTGDWAASWDRVRQVTIGAIYALIDEIAT